MPSCNTYHLTWVSLTLGVGYLFRAAPSKAQPLLLTLDEGHLLTAAVPDLQGGIAPLGPPVPAAKAPWVAPPSCWPWPQAWVAPQLPPLASGSGWLLTVTGPGLGHEVASPGRP